MTLNQINLTQLNEDTSVEKKVTKQQVRDEMMQQMAKDGYSVKKGTTQSSIFILQQERGTSSRAQMFGKIVDQYGGEYIEKSSGTIVLYADEKPTDNVAVPQLIGKNPILANQILAYYNICFKCIDN